MSLFGGGRHRSNRETRSFFSWSVFAVAVAVTFGLASDVGAIDPLLVSNGNDSGEGSLRAALKAAAQPGAPGHIRVVTDDNIAVTWTLTYEGEAPLAIYGKGQDIIINVNATLLAVSKGADLTVNGLNFRGPGGFSIKNRGDRFGDDDAKAGKGIFVKLRADQTGTAKLTLENVSMSGIAYHGVHISDCNLADACGAGSSGKGDGSPASIAVRLTNVKISEVGTGKNDADGIRVDERNAGDIRFVSRNSTFTRVGADGVELDEGHDGDVIVTVVNSTFAGNGSYCDPEVLKPFLPEVLELKFEDRKVLPSELEAIDDTPDDTCFGYDVALYDSGFVSDIEIQFDLDDGFMAAEEGPGSVQISLDGVQSEDNGRKGVSFRQSDQGDINVLVVQTMTGKNGDGDKTGLEVEQKGTGVGLLTIRNSNISDGFIVQNVKVIQE